MSGPTLWLLLLVHAVTCMNLGEYGNVRLFAKPAKEPADAIYRFVATNLEKAVDNEALQCPFAPSTGFLLADTEFFMLRDRAFYKSFASHSFPFPSKRTVTMKLGKTLVLPSPKTGNALFETMLKEMVKYPKYDCTSFKTLPSGKTQISLYHELSNDISVEELLSEATVSFNIETGNSEFIELWEMNVKGSFNCFFAPIDSAEQLGVVLSCAGSKSEELILTNRYYQKNTEYTVVRFDHQEGSMHRLIPILQDIFSIDFFEVFGSKLAAISFVPRARRSTCLIELHFVGTQLDTMSLMKWVKSLEACGIGHVHETHFKKGVYGFILRNRLLRVLQPLDHVQRKESLLYGVTDMKDFELVLHRLAKEKLGVPLRFGHLACTESHRGVIAIECPESNGYANGYEAFKYAVDALIFDDEGKMARLIESVTLEWSEEKAVVRIVFLFETIESIGLAALQEQVAAFDFGPYSKKPEGGPGSIAAFVSTDGLTAYPLGQDFCKSVSKGHLLSPTEVFSSPEHRSVELVLIAPDQVSRGSSGIRIVATDEIDHADLMSAMDLVHEESILRVRYSCNPGKLMIEVGRWEKDPQYKSLGMKLCPHSRISSVEHYLCVKPWSKSARFPEDAPEAGEHSLAVQFLEGSHHLVHDYVKDIIDSDIAQDVISFELGTGPFVGVSFASDKHVKALRMKIKSNGIAYKTISKNHLALLGPLPLFATFPLPTPTTTEFRSTDEFMKIKAGMVKKIPYINFNIQRCSTDPFLKAEQEVYKGSFPLKRYNMVLASFITALTDKNFPVLSLPFARLEVTVHNKHFKLSVHVKEYLGGLGAEEYGKLLVLAAGHLEKYPGAKGRIGNPALRPVKKPTKPSPIACNPPIKPVKELHNGDRYHSSCLKDIANIPVTIAPVKVSVEAQVFELLGQDATEGPLPVLSPEEEKDWACYFELIKHETDFASSKDLLHQHFFELIKASSLQFRPDLGEGYNFIFSEDGPVAIAKTWNGFAMVMKLAMMTLEAALIQNNLENPFTIELQPLLMGEPHITYTQCFQITEDDGSIHTLLNAFESLAFNLLHDSVSANIIRIGVSRGQSDSLYHIFADISLPSDLTPRYSASMAEFDFIWQHVVMRGSQ